MILTTEKQLVKLKITAEGEVQLSFAQILTSDEPQETDGEEAIPDKYINKHTAKSTIKPHKDFLNCLKQLRKHALEICEIEVDSKAISSWHVCGIKISGDVELKKSRVQLILAKDVKRTGKRMEFNNCPQITMYPEPDADSAKMYHDIAKLTPIVEDLIEEGFSYLNGKYEDETIQLKLFATPSEEPA